MQRRTILLASAAAVALNIGTAAAIAPFKNAFNDLYIKPADNAKLTKDFNSQACNVCHVKGKPKTEMNPYGTELKNLIQGSAQERLKKAKEQDGEQGEAAEKAALLKELDAAFKKAESLRPDPNNPETYGDRIKAGKLPHP